MDDTSTISFTFEVYASTPAQAVIDADGTETSPQTFAEFITTQTEK